MKSSNDIKLNDKLSIKAGFWYTISNFFVRAFGFITIPIFTRLLTQEEFGEYANFTTWLSLLGILCTLDLYSTISRAKMDFENDIYEYICSISLLGTAFTGICYFVVILFKEFFIDIFNMDMFYIHVIFLYLLVSPSLTILQTTYVQFMKYKLTVFLTVSSSLLSIGCSLVLVIALEDKLFGRVVGTQGVLFLFNIIIYLFLLKKGKAFKWDFCKYALAIAIPLIPHILSGNLLANIDKVIINKYCGAVDLALYSIGYTVSSIVDLLKNALNQAWVPWLFDNIKNGNISKIKNVSRCYLLVFVAIIIIICLLAPEIVLIVGGHGYIDAQYIIPPVAMGLIFNFVYTFYVNIEFYHKKTINISIGTGIAAIINIFLNLLLIPRFGYLAAAYTTTISYAFLFLFHFLIVKRIDSVKYYNTKQIVIVLCMTILLQLMIISLYQYFVIRVIIVIIYLLALIFLLYKKRELIIKFIK